MKLRTLMTAVLVFMMVPAGVSAEIVTEAVSYEQGGVKLEGHLAYDDAIEGKRPGVLVVHEWWGLNDYARGRAEKLAALGYNVFALDMYGKGKMTEHPSEASEWMKAVSGNVDAWRQRALAGLEILRKHPNTDTDRIAAIGYCFGGSTVQQLAYGGTDIKGIASFHGSLVSPPDDLTGGVPAKMLICHGAADPTVKKESVPDYIAAMEKSGVDWQLIMYGGAKHGFTNPGADARGMAALGYSESADRRSWEHMKLFFDEIF